MPGHACRIQPATRRIGIVDIGTDIQAVIKAIRSADIRIRCIDRVSIAIIALNRNTVHRRANDRTADGAGIGSTAAGTRIPGASVS